MTEASMIEQNYGVAGRNIKVFVRVRPFNEKEMGDKCCVSQQDEMNLTIGDTNVREVHNFAFDGIFNGSTSQSEVYEKVGL
jgi:hypothetical protein